MPDFGHARAAQKFADLVGQQLRIRFLGMMENADVLQATDLVPAACMVRCFLHNLEQYHGQQQEAKRIPSPVRIDARRPVVSPFCAPCPIISVCVY